MVTQDQLDSSIVEIVDQEEPALKLRIRKVCYLPYHEVVHLDKSTTKVRVVFDASCTRRLNDSLYACPPRSALIFDVLLRFHAQKTALTADIEKAFLNVAVSKDHRDL